MWVINSAEISKYGTLFKQLNPVDGKVDGEKCKLAMLKSQLSMETLGRIWDLSDCDNDGSLDENEFILAMHLVHRCVEGDMLPDNLPKNLVPPGKEKFFSHFAFPPPATWSDLAIVPGTGPINSLALISPHYQSVGSSCWPQFGCSQSYNFPPWAISADELAKSAQVFSTIDLDADGLVSGAEVRDVLMRSGLHQTILAQLWDLVDIQGSGMLNCEQFAVAMHLATDQLSSSPYARSLPPVLPPALVPPSFRPAPPDPAMFEESNRLIAEIEQINRERAEVEAAFATLTVDAQLRATETAIIHSKLDTLDHTARSLVNQRSEAERRLVEYAREKDTLEGILKDLRSHVSTERQKVEEVRSQVDNEQLSAKNQEEEINHLRAELSELIREEARLQDRVVDNRRRLEVIEAENRTAQTCIEKSTTRINSMESNRGQLLQVLDQYTNLLNGDTSTTEPDVTKVKTLLNNSVFDDNFGIRDLGFGGPTGDPVRRNTSAFGDLDWSSFDHGSAQVRGLGSSSVPLPLMSASRLVSEANQFGAQEQSVSSLGLPISIDPFSGMDPFNPDVNSKPIKDDPFGTTNLFSTSDPFKGLDPFGTDPFTSTADKSGGTPSDIVSAFDPFVTSVNRSAPTQNSFTGADFDSVFGPANATANPGDLFEADPFSSLEQAATTNDSETSAKKSPPPRPKTRPGAGKGSRERKSIGDTPTLTSTTLQTLGSLPDFGTSLTGSKFRTTDNSVSPINVHKSSMFSRSKGGGDLLAGRNNHAIHRASLNKGDKMTTWAPSGLSEEEQLSIATRESQRLARMEERARRQEEADLELALQLSKMDAALS
ncbi:hypothetical protein P879_00520 [Paragonimus westermani]|uniref:Epidermal growth factor receptor substrate 15 n=1 Tax=Paragonimus westermani TaxID=34504 RepID=A0A8T0DV91_9TREM|nr:hypothetical protein P879_00520 [Paragonimus westermani]